MRFRRLQVSNFQSIGELDFAFPGGLVLVDGWNEDASTHNGAGKSALLNAIVYGIYGRTPKSLTQPELVRTGATAMSVQIELEIDGKVVVINRLRSEKSGKVSLAVDGQPVGGLAKDVEAKIEQLVGLTFEQFTQTVYVFQGSTQRFISLNDTDKKKFLSTLLGLDICDEAYKRAHSALGKLELEFAGLTGKVDALAADVARQELETERLVTELTQSKEQAFATIAPLLVKIKDLATEIASLKEAAVQPDTALAETLSQLAAKKADILALIAQNDKNRRRVQELTMKIDRTARDINALSESAEPLRESKCPTCTQKWDKAAGKLDEIEAAVADQTILLGKMREELEETKVADPAKLNEMLSGVSEQIATEQAKDPVKQYTLTISSKESELSAMEGRVSDIKKGVAALQKTHERALLALSSARETLSNTRAAQDTQEDERKYLLAAKRIFSPVGLRAYIFGNIINELNARISQYLGVLSGGLVSLTFEMDEESGKLIEQCECGGIQRSIAALSGGEFRRVSLAADLALADVVSSRFAVYPNVLFLDEAFEGMDVAGREALMDLMQELAKHKEAIYVVDHATEFKTAFTNTIKLVKRSGVTTQE